MRGGGRGVCCSTLLHVCTVLPIWVRVESRSALLLSVLCICFLFSLRLSQDWNLRENKYWAPQASRLSLSATMEYNFLTQQNNRCFRSHQGYYYWKILYSIISPSGDSSIFPISTRIHFLPDFPPDNLVCLMFFTVSCLWWLFDPGSAGKCLEEFLEKMYEEMAADPTWADASPEELDESRALMEKRFLTHIYRYVFFPHELSQMNDALFSQHIKQNLSHITADHEYVAPCMACLTCRSSWTVQFSL